MYHTLPEKVIFTIISDFENDSNYDGLQTIFDNLITHLEHINCIKHLLNKVDPSVNNNAAIKKLCENSCRKKYYQIRSNYIFTFFNIKI